MDGIYLFGVASRRAEWLASRQTIVAENVANASTPGYVAKDISAFSEALETTRLEMAGRDPMHLVAGGGRDMGFDVRPEESWGVTHSGNSVSLPQEMMKAGEVTRDYSLNTAIVKAFHKMLLASVKG